AVASTLFYADAVRACPPAPILTDLLALACAIHALAALVCTAAPDASFRDWALLAVSVCASYQIRPAYLFMVGLVPVLGLLVLGVVSPPAELGSRARVFAPRVLILALVPLLAFCSLRRAVVGEFGLVSFGGINVVGLAAQLLTPEIARELPER